MFPNYLLYNNMTAQSVLVALLQVVVYIVVALAQDNILEEQNIRYNCL